MREEQDEDYVNTERRNGHDQYYDTDRECPAEHHVERDMQGKGIQNIVLEMITFFIVLPFIQKHCYLGRHYNQDTILFIITCSVLITF